MKNATKTKRIEKLAELRNTMQRKFHEAAEIMNIVTKIQNQISKLEEEIDNA